MLMTHLARRSFMQGLDYTPIKVPRRGNAIAKEIPPPARGNSPPTRAPTKTSFVRMTFGITDLGRCKLDPGLKAPGFEF